MHSPVSSQDTNSPDTLGHSGSSQQIGSYSDTQMERDMVSMLEEVTTARCSRINGTSSAQEDGDGPERPAKQQ